MILMDIYCMYMCCSISTYSICIRSDEVGEDDDDDDAADVDGDGADDERIKACSAAFNAAALAAASARAGIVNKCPVR